MDGQESSLKSTELAAAHQESTAAAPGIPSHTYASYSDLCVTIPLGLRGSAPHATLIEVDIVCEDTGTLFVRTPLFLQAVLTVSVTVYVPELVATKEASSGVDILL